jgi:hemoglobin/transferrin/lactoferrin receptor protein
MSAVADGIPGVDTRQLTWVNAAAQVAAQAVLEEHDRKSNNNLTRSMPQFPGLLSPHLRLCVCAMLGMASVLPAGAATSGTDGAGDLETVTVYARRLMPVSRVAATVTVIEQSRIESTLASDLGDLVRYEPGLTVRNDPFRFGLDTISIRGLGGNRVAVEIDGVPAAPGFAVGSYADSGRAFVDPAFLRRVEFLRGPASSLYGSDAIGGVMAMTTLVPADLLAASPDGLGLRTQAGYDSGDAGWNVAAIGAGEWGPGRWLLGYSRREGHQTDTAADVEPNPRDYTSDSVLLKYELPDARGGPLTFAWDGGQVEQQTSVDAFLGVGRFAATTALAGDDRQQRQRLSVHQVLGAAGSAFDSAEWRLYAQDTATDQDTWEVRSAVPPRTPAVQLDRTFDFDEETLGLEFTALRSLGGGAGLVHDVVYGIEATRSELTEQRNGLQTTLDTGATTNVILGETFPVRDLPLTEILEVGAFVQDEIRPADSRWSIVPALRVDYYDLTPTVDAIYAEDNPTSQPVGLEDVSFAPKLGATWRVDDAVGLFFQYAHGYRAPPPEDVNIGLEIPLFKIRAVPNPDLQPEVSDGFEFGLRRTGRTLDLTASVFDTEYRDFIESKVNIGVDPDTGVTLFQSQNVAEARIYGAELGALWRAGDGSAALDGWTGRLAASWTRGDNLVTDEPLNSIDPPSLVLGMRYDAPSTRWGGELVVTAVEAQTRVDDSLADLYATDGYATVDLLANWQITPSLRFNLGLFNLTDEEYIVWSDVRGRTATDPLVPYYTQAGFNASMALHWRF